MTDLSKIDWSKCELPEIPRCPGAKFSVHHRDIRDANLVTIGCGDDAQTMSVYLQKRYHGNKSEWFARDGTSCLATDAVLAAIDCSKQVDAFIEAEMRRMAEEALPPWRECTETESMQHRDCSEWLYKGLCPPEMRWSPVGNSQVFHPPGSYHFRTRAPKAEAKPVYHDAGVHCPRCGSTKMRSGTVNTDSGLDVGEHQPWTAPGVISALQSQPITTTAKCECICGARFESKEEHWPKPKEAAPKPEPKMPSAKPPDDWAWSTPSAPLFGAWILKEKRIDSDKPSRIQFIPDNKSTRDAMLACVAAFDEANGTAEGPLVIGWAGKTWMLVEVAK